uniref:small monomeric GTPase n=1 Tax=Pygocentrus nattereri TaxID=42514 RepID=A0AAR2K7B6_PYGNA
MSSGSSNFLLVPIPEYPVLDCVPNKNVKIVVLGASNVGKTALIVRFLTKRFIGDYEANTGALYSRKINLDGEQVSLQVQDTPCVSLQDDAEGLYCQEQINRSIYWADEPSSLCINMCAASTPAETSPSFWWETRVTCCGRGRCRPMRVRRWPLNSGDLTLRLQPGKTMRACTQLFCTYARR